MKDKRVYQRAPVELAASFGILTDEDIGQESATILNISQGGFCIESDKILKVGTNIKLSVELDKKEHVAVGVRSVWNKKIGDTGRYQIGLQIIDSKGPDFEKFLNFYCEELKKVHQEVN